MEIKSLKNHVKEVPYNVTSMIIHFCYDLLWFIFILFMILYIVNHIFVLMIYIMYLQPENAIVDRKFLLTSFYYNC
jgi:hypothetical protein